MKRRWLDGFLLMVLISGGVLAWKSGQERSRLTSTYERLASKTGDLSIGDPSKVHVLALETREPLHFAWRIYTPPNYTLFVGSTGEQSSSWTKDAREFIARVRFREDEKGELRVYTDYSGGSSTMTIGNKTIADLLHDRWDKILVEQAGRGRISAIEPDRAEVLLRLTLPDDLRDEAKKALSPEDQKRLVPVLYEWKVGRDLAKP